MCWGSCHDVISAVNQWFTEDVVQPVNDQAVVIRPTRSMTFAVWILPPHSKVNLSLSIPLFSPLSFPLSPSLPYLLTSPLSFPLSPSLPYLLTSPLSFSISTSHTLFPSFSLTLFLYLPQPSPSPLPPLPPLELYLCSWLVTE